VSVLLDSNAIVRWMISGALVSERAKTAILNAGARAFVSVACIYELEYKRALGKLSIALPATWVRDVSSANFRWLPINEDHAAAAALLPLVHRDPWDRVIAAQATVEGLSLISSDSKFALLGIKTIW
jgi:PIN domain nuclease of toxin-antitoxin system